MLHRVVSLLLVPTLLLQWVCLAHSHAGTGVHEPPGHNSTPHIHLHCLFGTSAHPGYEDGDHRPHLDCDSDDPEGAVVNRLPPTKDHDDDAVYFAASVMLGCKHGKVSPANLGALLPIDGALGSRPVAQASSSRRAHPPPLFLHQHCPLYLRSLTLLI